MSAELLVSAPVSNGEHKVLLGLANSGISKTLGNKKVLKNVEETQFNKAKTAKWKTKAGVFDASKVVTMPNACSR